MNEFRTCNICKGFNSEELISKLKELDPNASMVVGCQNMCVIGAKRPFVILNGIPLMANSVDELIEEVKKTI